MAGKVTTLEQELRQWKEIDKQRNEQKEIFRKKSEELESKLKGQAQEQRQKLKSEYSQQVAVLQQEIQILESKLGALTHESTQQQQAIRKLETEKLSVCSENLELREKCREYKSATEEATILQQVSSTKKHKKSIFIWFCMLHEENVLFEFENYKNSKEKIRELEQQLKIQSKEQQGEIEKEKIREKQLSDALEKQHNEAFRELQWKTYEEMKEMQGQHNEDLKKIEKMNAKIQSQKEDMHARQREVEKMKKAEDELKADLKIKSEELTNTQATLGQVSKELQVLQLRLQEDKIKQNTLRTVLYKLKQGQEELEKSLRCNHCLKFIQEPITLIPCGHSFCFGCKSAFTKECIKCGPKCKTEAKYRNELLDDIIGIYKTITALKENLLSYIHLEG